MDRIKILQQTKLFSDLTSDEIQRVLERTDAREAEFEKDRTIISQGDENTEIGIVLSGVGRSVIENVSGKTIIVALLERGSYLGLLLAANRGRRSPVTVQALERMTVMFIPYDRLMRLCTKDCAAYELLLRNCFECVSDKAMALYDRIDCLVRPSVREKVMAYLRRLSAESRSNVFMTPLDRNAMAEYINVDRSALSRELSRMKRDGMIDYYKSSFKLL